MARSIGYSSGIDSVYEMRKNHRMLLASSRGGKNAHQLGKAHEWTPQEASAVGRIGGRRNYGEPRKRLIEAFYSNFILNKSDI
jgi:hypothetical protein